MPLPGIFCSAAANQNVANLLVVRGHCKLGDLELTLFSDLATAMPKLKLAEDDAVGSTENLNSAGSIARDGPDGLDGLGGPAQPLHPVTLLRMLLMTAPGGPASLLMMS